MGGVKGVDISTHNGNVDFQSLVNAGVKFVIIRCGYGSDYTNQDDDWFEKNVKKAEAFGLPWGVYLYSYALNTSMAASEAQHVLRLLNGRKPLYGVWYDLEDKIQNDIYLPPICERFCSEIEKHGLYVGIYATLSWLETKLNHPSLDKYDKWVAQWNLTCDYTKPYGIWQYTDKLSIGNRAFDGNITYKDYPSIISGIDKEEDEMTQDEITKLVDKRIEAYFNSLKNKDASNYSKEAINFVKDNKVMNGYPDGSFHPKSYPTREELAQVIFNYHNNIDKEN